MRFYVLVAQACLVASSASPASDFDECTKIAKTNGIRGIAVLHKYLPSQFLRPERKVYVNINTSQQMIGIDQIQYVDDCKVAADEETYRMQVNNWLSASNLSTKKVETHTAQLQNDEKQGKSSSSSWILKFNQCKKVANFTDIIATFKTLNEGDLVLNVQNGVCKEFVTAINQYKKFWLEQRNRLIQFGDHALSIWIDDAVLPEK